MTQVLYEYELPVNFTRTSSFLKVVFLSNPYDVNNVKSVLIYLYTP